jgi:hypothetical protein
MFILYITSRYSHFNIVFSKPCQRQYELLPSLGVRRLSFTFHILIFSSENPQPNELKLARKQLISKGDNGKSYLSFNREDFF